MHKDPDYYVQGVLDGNRLMLSRTITLIESALPAHKELVHKVLERLLPYTGNAARIGITGVPGAGKSTFIDSFGTLLADNGHKVAVLAIDPSSARSGGSILGDKTRMLNLSVHDSAFIRPSPSGGTLGGVAGKTRESMLVCEAAGFDVVIIETVGVGQSETAVASMVDFFLVLMIAGAGDELQGIKKGILEVADAIIINKADGDNIQRAELARKEYETALHLLTPDGSGWNPPVLTCSAIKKTGLQEIWETIGEHRSTMLTSGLHEERRKKQTIEWLHFLLIDSLKTWFYSHPDISSRLPDLSREVENKTISAAAAAAQLLQVLKNHK